MAVAKTTAAKKTTTGIEPEKTQWQRLSAFLIDLGSVAKNQKNSHFKNKYADINALIAEINIAMSNHDFIVTQEVIAVASLNRDGGEPIQIQGYNFGFVVRTIVRDTITGDIMLDTLYPIISKDIQDPQKVGGANTYARRYSLLTTLMLQSDDDDGNSAATPPRVTSTPEAPKEKSKNDLVKEVQEAFNIKTPEDLAKLTAKVLGVEKETKTFQTLGVIDLNKILDNGPKSGESAPF